MQETITVLHLDDDPLELRQFARALNQHPGGLFQVISFENISALYDNLEKIKKVDIVVLDIHLADGSLFEAKISPVAAIRKYHPDVVTLISSALDDPRSVLKSLQAGADNFFIKKNHQEDLVERLISVRRAALLKRGVQFSAIKDVRRDVEIRFVGDMMRKIAVRVPQIMNSAICSVYIEGESGTGKEVVVDIFAAFVGHDVPFVKLNCGSIPENLIESELFGHVRGSFTGAQSDRQGVIEAASGGWLFLDEVSSLSASAQTALLRVLENQEVIRIGENRARKVNVRCLAASNIPLKEYVLKGRFRNDLWQRLRETEIILKPLRERKEEIPELVAFFCETMHRGPYTIEHTALNILSMLPWNEGNVRELRNCLRAMTEHQNEGVLSPMSIPERILSTFQVEKEEELLNGGDTHFVTIPIQDQNGQLLTFDEMSSALLKAVFNRILVEHGKINVSKLAKNLNMARSTLLIKMKEMLKSALIIN